VGGWVGGWVCVGHVRGLHGHRVLPLFLYTLNPFYTHTHTYMYMYIYIGHVRGLHVHRLLQLFPHHGLAGILVVLCVCAYYLRRYQD
jgi:hypothetical protein